MAAFNADFHTTVATLAELPLTATILRNLWMRIGPIYALSRPMRHLEHEGRIHPHEELIAALRQRDVAAAQAAVARDFEHARRWIEPRLT